MTDTAALVLQLRARLASGGNPYTPATAAQVAQAEDRLGFSLPHSLRQLYVEIANGGFGPAFGIYGVGVGAHLSQDGRDLVDQYLLHRRPSQWNQLTPEDPEYALWREGWPERVLPLAGPACSISYALDATTGIVLSANADDIVQGITYSRWLKREAPTLEAWLERWLAGEELPCSPTGSWGGHDG